MIKYGMSVITEVMEIKEAIKVKGPQFEKRIASIPPIKLDLDRFLYLRNHSVSALEVHGPNRNGDGFPMEELISNHSTFINKRVTLDHQDHLVVGMVLDSAYIYPQEKDSPETGHYVQNILAIDKKVAERIDPHLIEDIYDGKITDTSMGANVQYSICSLCGNVAYSENQFCSHIRNYKMQHIKLASGEERLVYEICRGVVFFEDSIIRPLDRGGVAGGEGADVKAKILERVGSLLETSLRPYIESVKISAPKIPLPSQLTQKDLAKDTSDIERPPEKQPVNAPILLNTPQKEEPEEKKYTEEDVEEKIKEFMSRDKQIIEETDVSVEDKPNLFSYFPDEEIHEIIKSFSQYVRVASNETEEDEVKPTDLKYDVPSENPDKKEEMRKYLVELLDLIKGGTPVEEALEMVWSHYLKTKEG